MAEIQENEIEVEARAIMRKMIEESGWYPLLRDEHRQKRIEQDVEMHWHLMRWEAAGGGPALSLDASGAVPAIMAAMPNEQSAITVGLRTCVRIHARSISSIAGE